MKRQGDRKGRGMGKVQRWEQAELALLRDICLGKNDLNEEGIETTGSKAVKGKKEVQQFNSHFRLFSSVFELIYGKKGTSGENMEKYSCKVSKNIGKAV